MKKVNFKILNVALAVVLTLNANVLLFRPSSNKPVLADSFYYENMDDTLVSEDVAEESSSENDIVTEFVEPSTLEKREENIDLIPMDFNPNPDLTSNGSFEIEQVGAPLGVKDWLLWNAGTNKTDWSTTLDRTTFQEGSQSLFIQSNHLDVRLSPSTKVTAQAGKSYEASVWFKLEDVIPRSSTSGVYFRTQVLNADNQKILDPIPTLPPIKGTSDWTEYKLFLNNLPEGTATIQLEIFVEYAKGKIWMDNVAIREDYGLKFKPIEGDLYPSRINDIEIEYIGQPPEGAEISLISSDTSVIRVTPIEGETNKWKMESLKVGLATLTAQVDDMHKISQEFVVISILDPEEMKFMRDRWFNRLTGNTIENPLDPDYQKAMLLLSEEAFRYWDTFIKKAEGETETRPTIWADLDLSMTYPGSGNANATLSEPFQTAFTRVRAMALAYTSSGSQYYQDAALGYDVKDALLWLYNKGYNQNYDVQHKIYGNWWHWQIGIPQALSDIVILMYDEFSSAEINNFYLTLENFNESPFYVWNVFGGKNIMTSANLMDTALISILKAMIGEKGIGFQQGTEALAQVLPYVKEGDGFYIDGSCIQHSKLAYTGGYGSTLLKGIEKILFALDETSWKPTHPEISNVYEWILNGYKPLIVDGAMLDMVKGRGMSRVSTNEMLTGKQIILPMVNIAQTAPEDTRQEILAFVKQTALEGIAYFGIDNYFVNMPLADMVSLKKLLEDDSIIPLTKLSYHKIFASMDKVMHHSENFSLGISMFSKRVGNFEYGNGENKKGFHIADGALFLHNGDQGQFSENYWPTVDPMRLPGITTDHTTPALVDWQVYTNDKDWVGGSVVGNLYGSTGMNFAIQASTLNGKKSWFVFDDEIVNLGIDIQSANNQKEVETIVENRKIKDTSDNQFIVNDSIFNQNELGEKPAYNATWAWLEGNTLNNRDSIGYFFPEPTDLKVIREQRSGSWRDINNSGPTDLITKSYLSLAINHGVAPVNGSYSYIVLPSQNQAKVKEYAENPDVIVLSNTSDLQAAEEIKLKVTGINFWKAGVLGGVEVLQPSSVTLWQKEKQWILGISDPTQRQNQLTLNINIPYTSIESQSDEVEEISPGKFVVNTVGSAGKSYELVLNMEEPSPTPTATPSPTPTATPSSTPTATPSSTPTATPSPKPTSKPTPTPIPTPSLAVFVENMYQNILGRPSDVAGKKDWLDKLTSKKINGSDFANGFLNSIEFKNKKLNNSQYAEILYKAVLGRNSDSIGKAGWVEMLDEGISRLYISTMFFNSDEFTSLCKQYKIDRGTLKLTHVLDQNVEITRFVYRLYKEALGRDPDSVGIENWARQLLYRALTPESVAEFFVLSSEFGNKKISNSVYVEILYKVFLGRNSDLAGLNNWVDQLNRGKSRVELLKGFSGSDEFKKFMYQSGL